MSYSLDTSGFLDAWVRNYPIDVFPTVWERLGGAATSGVLFVSDEVLQELERKDDGAHLWVKARPQMMVGVDAQIEAEVIRLMARFPRLVDTKKGRSGGDPFVIAVAIAHGLTVITGEHLTGNPASPKIPDVCKELGIPCITLLKFFREQGWNL